MSINPVQIPQIQAPKIPDQQLPLIGAKDIKAILYLGIRGEIALPIENHKVDIIV